MSGAGNPDSTRAEARRPRRERSRRQALVSGDRWLVSYADFMTLLFALFVVLFATASHSPEAFGKLTGAIHAGFGGSSTAAVANQPPRATIRPDEDLLAAELKTVLGDALARHQVSLLTTPDGLVLSFRELGFFHSGEAAVLPGQAQLILRAGAILQRHGARLRVEGHSDDQPIHTPLFASNWELSAARAMTVLLLLVDDAHYDPTRLSMAGYGPYRPVAGNGSIEGRQKNRRVDLVVLHGEVAVDTGMAREQPPAGGADSGLANADAASQKSDIAASK